MPAVFPQEALSYVTPEDICLLPSGGADSSVRGLRDETNAMGVLVRHKRCGLRGEKPLSCFKDELVLCLSSLRGRTAEEGSKEEREKQERIL